MDKKNGIYFPNKYHSFIFAYTFLRSNYTEKGSAVE